MQQLSATNRKPDVIVAHLELLHDKLVAAEGESLKDGCGSACSTFLDLFLWAYSEWSVWVEENDKGSKLLKTVQGSFWEGNDIVNSYIGHEWPVALLC